MCGPDGELIRNSRITSRNNSLAVGSVVKRPQCFSFCNNVRKTKVSKQAYFDHYKFSEGLDAKSIQLPFLSSSQSNGRTKGLSATRLGRTVVLAFIRVQYFDTSDPLVCYLHLFYSANHFLKQNRFISTKAYSLHKSGKIPSNCLR
jgi:hypothetical protein